MRRLVVVVVLLALCGPAVCDTAAETAAKEKAIRLKTTRQLKEILTELKIKVPKDAGKEALRSLALKHDAITKYEELHPEKKKKQPEPGVGSMMFGMLDKDNDGKVTRTEFAALGAMGAAQGQKSSPEHEDQTFKLMDANGDGSVSAQELDVWFEAMQSGMPPPGRGGGGGGPSGAGAKQPPKQPPKPKPAPQAKAKATPEPPPAEEDDDELPSHDEL